MTGERLEPTPAKRLGPKTSTLDHSAILPVCPKISGMDDVRRYHVRGIQTHVIEVTGA